MDLQQLKHCLQAAGVPEDGYLLIGLDPPGPSARERASSPGPINTTGKSSFGGRCAPSLR